MSRPGQAAFRTAQTLAIAAAALALAGIWTGDGRWWATACLAAATALIAVITGSAQAAANEKPRQPGECPTTHTVKVQPTTARPKPPRKN